MKRIIAILIWIPYITFAQTQESIDSLLLQKVRFNEDSARYDIKNGRIRILSLLSNFTIEDSYAESDNLEFVQDKYGFTFYYEEFNIPKKHLRIKEAEYNSIVFNYLDSLCNCNSEKSIYSDLRERFKKKRSENSP